ncbi:MAG: putative phosphatase [Actinobacteria bacterium ADurb.Bin346]|nr:MAG: putative phosphatase [Actinobacteria bacterium ADurb.Bin346]
MIKLVVTDVDGTLLDDKSELSELNRQALLDCRKNGIGVILATGKSIKSIKFIIDILELKLPQITLNGTVVIDDRQDVIYSLLIGQSLYYELLKTIKEMGYKPLAALTDGNIYYDSYDKNYAVYEKVNEPIYKTDMLEKDEFAKNCVSIGLALKETDPLDDFLRRKYSKILHIVRSGEYFFDMINPKASKGNALHYIIRNTRIKRADIAVFGDSPNDMSMFEYAGLRIAVKNSFPEILAKADYITDENYNSGLGKAIYRHILK